MKYIILTLALSCLVDCQYFSSQTEKETNKKQDSLVPDIVDNKLEEEVQDTLIYDEEFEDDCCDEEAFFIIIDEERSEEDIVRENTLKGDVKEMTTVYLNPVNDDTISHFTTEKTEKVRYKNKKKQQTLTTTYYKRVKTKYFYNRKRLVRQERIFIQKENPNSNHIAYDTLRNDYKYNEKYDEDNNLIKSIKKQGIHDVAAGVDWDIYLYENKWYENDLLKEEDYEKNNGGGSYTKERKTYDYVFYPNKKIKKKRVQRFDPDNNNQIYVAYYTYNSKGQLIEYKETRGGTYYEQFTYEDFNDKPDETIEKHIFTYNTQGLRATKTVESPYVSETYSGKYTYKYDNYKNLVGVTLYNLKDSLLAKSSCTFKYDKQGNWIQKVVYDAQGKPYSLIKRFITYTAPELNIPSPMANENVTLEEYNQDAYSKIYEWIPINLE